MLPNFPRSLWTLLHFSTEFFYGFLFNFFTRSLRISRRLYSRIYNLLFTDFLHVFDGFIHGFKTCFLRISFTGCLRIFFTGYLRHCFTDFGPVIHGFFFTDFKNPYVTGSLYARGEVWIVG
jgi:hypothetical protein